MTRLETIYLAMKHRLRPHLLSALGSLQHGVRAIVGGVKLTFNENVLIRAGSLAYTSLISSIPALIVLLYTLNTCLQQTPQLVSQLETIFAIYLLPSTSREAVSIVFDIARQVSANISALGLLALVFTLLLMARELETHIQALCKTSSKLVISLIHYIGSILVSGLLLGVIYGVMTILQQIDWIAPHLLKIDIPFLMLIGFYTVVLRIFSGYHLSWKSSMFGSAVAGIGLILSWKVCNYYFVKSVAYSAYGALIYVPTILLWVYVVWCCILFGASVAASMQALSTEPKP